MKITETVVCRTRASWRTWLSRNHRKKKEIWLIFFKKKSGKPTVTYEEAVEEAICYGWIDSILQRLDVERYAQKFTPRRIKTKWSATNIRRAEKMVHAGRMTAAGLAKFRGAKAEIPPASRKDVRLPVDLNGILQANGKAFENYFKLPPSLRRQYAGWIMSGKREDTRLRRLREMIDVLERGRRLGLK